MSRRHALAALPALALAVVLAPPAAAQGRPRTPSPDPVAPRPAQEAGGDESAARGEDAGALPADPLADDPFARPPLAPGAPLPDLRLPTIDGATLALSSFRGTKLLLIEFASW